MVHINTTCIIFVLSLGMRQCSHSFNVESDLCLMFLHFCFFSLVAIISSMVASRIVGRLFIQWSIARSNGLKAQLIQRRYEYNLYIESMRTWRYCQKEREKKYRQCEEFIYARRLSRSVDGLRKRDLTLFYTLHVALRRRAIIHSMSLLSIDYAHALKLAFGANLYLPSLFLSPLSPPTALFIVGISIISSPSKFENRKRTNYKKKRSIHLYYHKIGSKR